jgi:hypothetical protein
MDYIYNEIKSRNYLLVKNKGINYDPILKNKEPDNRLCLAIFSNINSLDLEYFYKDLEKLSSSCIYYTYDINSKNIYKHEHGTLHFTLLQILGFDYFKQLNDYSALEQILPILQQILPLKIKYKGTILTTSGIIICGYPDKDINKYRNEIREVLKDIIQEPYSNDSCHSTICRFTDKIDLSSLEHIINKYENYDFGETIITSFNVGYGTWKLNSYEIKIVLKI